MDTADRVSVVALLVSLIALVIALLQALQQYYATADGYRNCAESVIGPWHRTRHRRPVPSEFRFETVYDAPLIRLLPMAELADRINKSSEKRLHLLYPLHPEPCCEGERLLHETVDPPEASLEGWRSFLPKWSSLRDIPNEDKVKDAGEGVGRTRRRENEEKSSALVSWIDFLKALHLTYSSYGQVSNKIDHKATKTTLCLEGGEAISKPAQPVIVQQRFHWDFRGSDITRPVAQTRLGDIILFALRMGMQWRRINVERGTLLAMGNGYSLSSANRSGLSLTFTSTGHHKLPPRITPSEYADKLLLGILPGDPDLVGKDFSLVSRRNKEGGKLEEAILDTSESIIERILEPHGIDKGHTRIRTMAAKHDLKKLLCPFFAQEYSNFAIVRFKGWPRHRAASFLSYYESRVGFIQQLDAEVRRDLHPYTGKDLESLRDVKARLDELKDNYPSDFYCVSFTPQYGSEKDTNASASFLSSCRQIFERCTESLKQHNWDSKVEDRLEGGSTRYAFLVAAHTAVTNSAIDPAAKEFEEAEVRLKKRIPGRPLRPSDWAEVIGLEQQAPDQARNRWLGNPIFYFRMNKIVQHMRSEDRGIRQELARLGIESSDAEAQLAWWMMMIRGIAWDMSCYREPWPAEEPSVPSIFYGDPTPVMLA